MEGMSEPLLRSRNENKFKFYQLIYIDNFVYKDISKMLLNSGIKISSIDTGRKLYLVEAPNKLARLLSKFKNYELFGFNDNQFISLLGFVFKLSWSINRIEFIGENYFDEELSQDIDELLSSKDFPALISLIKSSNLKINKFQTKNKGESVFYRSGMIYSNDILENLVDLFISFLEDKHDGLN